MKRVKKLTLKKETLQQLEASQLRRIAGGDPITAPTCFCTFGGGSCYENTCAGCTYQEN